MSGYPVEEVECPRCDGNGEFETWDEFGEGWARCWSCGGSGYVEVCANCYDDWDGCTVCQPPAPDALSGASVSAIVSESAGGAENET